MRSLLAASFLALQSFILLVTVAGLLLLEVVTARRPGQFGRDWHNVLAGGFALVTDLERVWVNFPRWASTSTLGWVLGETTLCSFVALIVAVVAAGAKTRRSWQEEPPSPQRLWLERKFCTPVFWVGFFRR